MNIQDAKEELKRTIQAYTAKTHEGLYRIPVTGQRPVLLMGPPGIGKTAIVEQAAGECGLGMVAYTMTHHTRQSAIGLPMIEKKSFGGREYAVTDYTMSEILASVYEQAEYTGKQEGILFLDEINCVSETLMPALLQFLQYKTFGTHRLPRGWIVVAAGNPARYNQSVRELDMAVLDRVKWMEIEPELSVWKAYARNRGLHPAVLSFLDWKPESFYAAQTDARGRGFVTARGWEDLSRMLETLEELGLPVTEELPGQYLQQGEIAREFCIYYRLYEACKATPYQELLRLPYDERLCVLQLMLQRVYRMADDWRNAGELGESLRYFFQGIPWEDLSGREKEGMFPEKKRQENQSRILAWSVRCEEQLGRRKQGIQVKKDCGILSWQEEQKELLLEKEIRRYLGIWRVETAKGSVRAGEASDPGEEEALDNTSGFRKDFRRQAWEKQEERQVQTAGELGKLLQEYGTFMEEAFAGKQELFLFCMGLLEHKNTVLFLGENLPGFLERLEKGRDLKRAEEELRAALSS